MTFEETMATLLDVKLAPVAAELAEVRAQLEQLRRAVPPALVTVPEAARRLGVSEATVRRWIRSGQLAGRRIGHGFRVDLGALHGPTLAEVREAAGDGS